MKAKVLAAVGVAILLWLGSVAWDYFDEGSIPHVAMQYQLKMFGSAMYEYHSSTGKWPAVLDDLAGTSLPLKSRVWRTSAKTMVFLWPKELKADPKDNGGVLLAYYPVGLFNRLGRVWVCWGDLRTEHMRERDLRIRLVRLGK